MNVLELVRARFSVREFCDTDVREEDLRYILEAGRAAPSACNRQPQRVYVVRSEEKRAALAEVCRFTFGAPVILAIGYDTEREWKNKLDGGKGSGETDAAIVTTQMMLAAWERGVGSCYVGYFSPEQIREALSLPKGTVVTALLPIGYPKEGVRPFYMHDEYREFSDTISFI